MRRTARTALGGLQLLVAAALAYAASRLPAPDDVAAGFGRVGTAAQGTRDQVRVMREQVGDLRDRDWPRRAAELKAHAAALTKYLDAQAVNFDTVDALGASLGDVAAGLDGWAAGFDADKVTATAAALGSAADYLDKGLAATAGTSAAALDKASAALEADAKRIDAIVQAAPPDLKAVREVYDGLASYDAGLDKTAKILDAERMTAMKDGLGGMESALSTTAGQVDKLADYKYPNVRFEGIKPVVEQKPFWGEGEDVAKGLRKAAAGAAAANKQIATLEKELPELQKSIAESRKVVARTRDALGGALKKQKELDEALAALPKRSAALAEALPQACKALAAVFRDGEKFKETADALRKTKAGLEDAAKNWPGLAGSLKKSSAVLKGASDKLKVASAEKNRAAYREATEGTVRLARTLADLLPAATDQFDSRLGQQDHALGQMEAGLGEVTRSLPEMSRGATDLLAAVRWLLWLAAGVVGLHAALMLAEARATPRASA